VPFPRTLGHDHQIRAETLCHGGQSLAKVQGEQGSSEQGKSKNRHHNHKAGGTNRLGLEVF
jgi:hypothetical protein